MAPHTQFRSDPSATLHRIEKLEADRRRVLRSLTRCTPGSPIAVELSHQRSELDEQLNHLRDMVAQAAADGFKVWSREDFTRGDFVEFRGTWYEVLRVNPKSLTIPHPFNSDGHAVVRSGDGPYPEWHETAGYHDGITGRRGPEEVATDVKDE